MARSQLQGRKASGLAKGLCVAPAQEFGSLPAFAIIHGTAALMKDSLLQAAGAMIASAAHFSELQ